MESKKTQLKSNNIATQSNNLIESFYRTSLLGKKLLLAVISTIEPDDKKYDYYRIQISDFKNIIGATKTKKDYYKVLHKIADDLVKERIEIREGSKLYITRWIAEIEEDKSKKTIGLSFPPKLYQYLSNLKGNFTKLRMSIVMNLQSVYSIRMYEILKSYHDKGIPEIELEVDVVRKMLGIDDNKFKQYYNFKQKVLEVSRKELEKKSNLFFEYEGIREGRKIRWLVFEIKLKKNISAKKEKQHSYDNHDKDGNKEPIKEEILKYIPEEFHNDSGLSLLIAEFVKSQGIEYVIQKALYTSEKSNDNWSGFFRKALQFNWGIKQKQCQIDIGAVISWRGQEIKILSTDKGIGFYYNLFSTGEERFADIETIKKYVLSDKYPEYSILETEEVC